MPHRLPETYSDNAIRKNKTELNPMSAEQKRELYLKLNESEYMVKYKYEYITYELASLGLKDTMPREVSAEKDVLLEEISKLKKEIADIKLTYRAYANLEKRIPQAIDPEYLRIVEYNNIDIALEELKKKEEQKRIRKNIGWGLVYD